MVTPIKILWHSGRKLLIMTRLPWTDECQRVCSVLVGLPEIFFAANLASNHNRSGHNESLVHWCYGKQMVPIKAQFPMSGQCRFDVNNKVLGTWIGTVWPRPCAFVCGTFMADATGQDRTESKSRYDWLRAGASELWIVLTNFSMIYVSMHTVRTHCRWGRVHYRDPVH